MSRVLSVASERLRIGDCECPGKPHEDGDHAELRPRLTPQAGMEAQAILSETKGTADYITRLGLLFLRDGLLGWDVQDDDGEPAPHDLSSLQSGMYDWDTTVKPIVDKLFDLYGESAMRPFVTAVETYKSSRNGQTKRSTSATRKSSRATPRP